jgi:hypothetical protein
MIRESTKETTVHEAPLGNSNILKADSLLYLQNNSLDNAN